MKIGHGNLDVTGGASFRYRSCYSNDLNSNAMGLLSMREGWEASGQATKEIEEKKDNRDSGSIRWQMPVSPS